MRIGSLSTTGSNGSIAAATTLALVAWTSSLAAEREPTRLTRADCRVRLLNFIAQSPIDCPVAFVWDHDDRPWAKGRHYEGLDYWSVDGVCCIPLRV